MSIAFVTGATGFIGSRLVRRLVGAGWTVHAAVRPEAKTAVLDPAVVRHDYDGTVATLTAGLAAARPDVVFHLASLYLTDHHPDQVDALVGANVLLTAQLAEAMVGTGTTRLVNTGTAWQHFEGAAYEPVNLYAATKQAGADLLRYYHAARGLSVVTLKLFDTYGTGDPRRKLIALLVDAAAAGDSLAMSPGDQTVDLTHVDDVVEGFLLAAARLIGSEEALDDAFFLSGERFVVRDLVAHVGQSLGRPIDATFGARPHRPREVMVPVEPGGAVLPGWAPRHRLATSLPDLLPDRIQGAAA